MVLEEYLTLKDYPNVAMKCIDETPFLPDFLKGKDFKTVNY